MEAERSWTITLLDCAIVLIVLRGRSSFRSFVQQRKSFRDSTASACRAQFEARFGIEVRM
jgi:hypothetical protein